jgi:beta-mannosidase
MWCGNNEIDEAWHNWDWREPFTAEEREQIWSAYEEIFHRVLPAEVDERDPGRFYWPSSPSIGWGHDESLRRGDSHYWGVWHGREPFRVFEEKMPRFASEFGFQSYPSLETVKTFTAPEDRQPDSPVMVVHQKHATGLEIVQEYLKRWYREPKDFDSFLYVSQLLQARGIGMALEAQRRAMPHTMGSLYWQLNDTWPVASWSSLDYRGSWKALHHVAKKTFAPVLVSPFLRDGSLEIHVISERRKALRGTLEMHLVEFDGTERWTREVEVQVGASSSVVVHEIPVADMLGDADPSHVALQLLLRDGRHPIAERIHYFTRPRELRLPPVNVIVELERDGEGGLLRVTSEVLAKSVYLSHPGDGVFIVDNYFDLLPGQERTVRIRLDSEIADPLAELSIRTLRDTY